MFKIFELYEEEIQIYNEENKKIAYFLKVVKADRKKVDESFGHSFGIEVRYGVEYSFEMAFVEAMDINGDIVEVDSDMRTLLEEKAAELLAEEEPEVLNKLYF